MGAKYDASISDTARKLENVLLANPEAAAAEYKLLSQSSMASLSKCHQPARQFTVLDATLLLVRSAEKQINPVGVPVRTHSPVFDALLPCQPQLDHCIPEV
jgi:hypothetical protein